MNAAAAGNPLLPTLLKLALPLAAIALTLAASRRRGIDWREGLGIRGVSARQLVAWIGAWIVWIALSEMVIRRFGLAQAQPWPAYSPLVFGLRVLAIGIAGPVAEELAVRGVFLHLLARTRLGKAGAVVVTALGWAAMHYRYGFASLALIAADGVFLGVARQRSRSLWVPIALHVIGNLVSIAQSNR